MTRVRPVCIALCTLAVALAGEVARGDEVRLRGGVVRQGTVLGVDDAGVSLRIVTEDVEVISWDRVRQVTGPFALDADDYAGIADTAWRARYRLERGDPRMAQPLFETLYERYRGQTSETALVVSEGVLRCRLQAGAAPSAVLEPYLQTIRMRRAGVGQRAYLDLQPIIDPRTDLLFAVPPLLVFESDALRLNRTELALEADPVVLQIADLYDCAIARATTQPDCATPDLRVEHAGARLLHLLLTAQGGNDAARSSARSELRETLGDTVEPWLAAWCRGGLGVSLCLQSDADSRLQGVLELLHVPLLYAAPLPDLARASARAAANELAALGDLDQAAQVRTDFAVPASAPTTNEE